MTKIFLTDVDGVLLDWDMGMEYYIKENTNFDITQDIRGFKKMHEWLKCEEEEVAHLVDEFHRSESYSRLPAFEDAVDVVKNLKDDGWRFVAITANSKDKHIRRLRRENIEKFFPDTFEDIISVEATESKEHVLKKFSPTFWVDDLPSHVMSGINCGHTSFYLPRTAYNRKDIESDKVIEVESWNGIEKHLSRSEKS